MTDRYRSFVEFYPFYLSEHRNRTCRRLHFAGTTLGLALLALAAVAQNWWLVVAGLATGYLFAWVGHFFFEKNRPATFTHPLYSFAADWVMWWQMLSRRIEF